jgi:thiol:disulfide interchange protein DsbD
VVAGLGIFFVAMATSMFGAFDLTLPRAVEEWVSSQKGLGFFWAFVMGLLAGVVAAPCTGPVLAGVLTFVATTRSAFAGFFLLFVYALGVGLPFFVLGTFSIRLPKSGPWMDAVKSVFGLLLLGAAVWFVRPFLPELKLPGSALALAALSGGVVAAGILLGAVHRSFHGPALERALKSAGVASVVLGLTLRMVGASEPPVAWVYSHDEALARARAEGKPVLIDFYADWCAGCVELDKHVFTDARVQDEARRFVMLKLDATRPSDEMDALHDRYGVNSMPIVLFLGPDGRAREEPKIVGYIPPEPFVAAMRKVQ